MKKYLSTGETADQLGLHSNTVRRYSDDGKIKCFRDANDRRKFHVTDIEEFKKGFLRREEV